MFLKLIIDKIDYATHISREYSLIGSRITQRNVPHFLIHLNKLRNMTRGWYILYLQNLFSNDIHRVNKINEEINCGL